MSSPPPDFLTVEEAAAILRIGRTAAYPLAREYLATNGQSGLPCRRIGRLLRVPRAALEAWLGAPITWPLDLNRPTQPDHGLDTIDGRRKSRRSRTAESLQSTLQFPART